MRVFTVAAMSAALTLGAFGCDGEPERSIGVDGDEQRAGDESVGAEPIEERVDRDPCSWSSSPPRERARAAAPEDQWGHATIASPEQGYGGGVCDGHVVEFETSPEGAYRVTVAHDPGLFTEADCEAYGLRLAVWTHGDGAWDLVEVSSNRGGVWFIDGCYFTETVGEVVGATAIRAHATAWRPRGAGSRANTPLAVMIERTN